MLGQPIQPMAPMPPGLPLFPAAGELPVGTVVPFAGRTGADASPPAEGYTNIEQWGWLPCDGSMVSSGHYPELFAALGYLYGGSGENFNLPDYRGVFLRGVDAGAGKDEDVNDRTPAAGGKPDEVGSTQDFAMQKHMHTYTMPGDPEPLNIGDKGATPAVQSTEPKTLTSTPTDSPTPPGNVKVSDHETRPANIYVNFIIKSAYVSYAGTPAPQSIA